MIGVTQETRFDTLNEKQKQKQKTNKQTHTQLSSYFLVIVFHLMRPFIVAISIG